MAGTNASYAGIASADIEYEILCDDNGSFLRVFVDGLPTDLALDGVTPYVVAGTVKACNSTNDYEVVELCLKANTAGPGYAIGDQVVLTRWFNVATGTPVQVAELAYNATNGGAVVATPLTAANFDECASASPSFTETLVCVNGVTHTRRTSSTGVVTFYGDNGAVATPAAYTIGDCFPNQRQAIPVCFFVNTAPTVTISGWQVASTGQTTYTRFYYYDPANNTQYAPALVTVVDCDSRVIQTYRIAGTAAGTSTPSTVPGDNPTVGNTVTIAAGFKSISWEFLRQTAQSSGAADQLTINGFIVFPGSGVQYQQIGKTIGLDGGKSANPYQFTAVGNVFIEITVIR